MPDQNKEDPGKKPMDDWFVGNEEVKPTQKQVPPPLPPPLPQAKPPAAKPPGKGPLLLVVLGLLALCGSGGYYFYRMRFQPPKVEEVTVEMPKQPDVAPAPTAPVEPVIPPPVAPPSQQVHSPSVSAGVRPAKRPATKKEEEPAQPIRAKEEPAPPKVEAPPKQEQAAVASSGVMLWSGKVDKNGTIVIDAGKSDSGTVNGAVLPGVPVTVRVEPKGFSVAEPPSAASGWKRIAIHSQKKAHIVVTVFWNTKPQ
jgi:hypothetical protein